MPLTIFHFRCNLCGATPAAVELREYLSSWMTAERPTVQTLLSLVAGALDELRTPWVTKKARRSIERAITTMSTFAPPGGPTSPRCMICAPNKQRLLQILQQRPPPAAQHMAYEGRRTDHQYAFTITHDKDATTYQIILRPRLDPPQIDALDHLRYDAFIKNLGTLDDYLEADAHRATRALAHALDDQALRGMAGARRLTSIYGPWMTNCTLNPRHYDTRITLQLHNTVEIGRYLHALISGLPALQNPRLTTR